MPSKTSPGRRIYRAAPRGSVCIYADTGDSVRALCAAIIADSRFRAPVSRSAVGQRLPVPETSHGFPFSSRSIAPASVPHSRSNHRRSVLDIRRSFSTSSEVKPKPVRAFSRCWRRMNSCFVMALPQSYAACKFRGYISVLFQHVDIINKRTAGVRRKHCAAS
jgi:hypothetical protein